MLLKDQSKLEVQSWIGPGIKWVIYFIINPQDFYSNYDELNKLVGSVQDNGGVYFVPAFSGLFSPYWNLDATGTLLGLT